LRELRRLRPWIAVRDTFLGWLGIACGFALVAAFPVWFVVALAIPLIGTRYYSLLIVAHDGLHRRLFESPKASDLWNDLFLIGPIGAITRLNRRNHMIHHGQLATPRDPDRYKYVGSNKTSRLRFVLVLTGLPYVLRAVRNVFFPPGSSAAPDSTETRAKGYSGRDIAILAGWQVVLIGGLTAGIGWWAYPVLWLLPVYAFGYAADIVRVFCEHSAMTGDDEADATLRLVSFTSNRFERQFFAPNNMNCHIAHHLWPAIPYYNLPETERRIRAQLLERPAAPTWRRSYTGHLIGYWRWLGHVGPAPQGVEAR
jgi:fatty acid desaturase